VLLALVLLVFIVYRLASPWTPFWVDLAFIVLGLVVLSAMPKSSNDAKAKPKDGDAL
jgi:hypothetical protein